MASGPITSWKVGGGKNGNGDRLYFLGLHSTVDGDFSHEIKRCLLLGRKAMTNLDSVLKSRDITLPTKVHIVKESEVALSCPTLGNPMDCSLPGSSIHGIFQARILEWVAISFSRGSPQPRVSCIAGRFFTDWATREAHSNTMSVVKCKAKSKATELLRERTTMHKAFMN